MSRDKNYPEPKPICPFCEGTELEYQGVWVREHRFTCKKCGITNKYSFDKTAKCYHYMIRKKVYGIWYVPYDEWCMWAISYYTTERLKTSRANRRFTKRYNLLCDRGLINNKEQ